MRTHDFTTFGDILNEGHLKITGVTAYERFYDKSSFHVHLQYTVLEQDGYFLTYIHVTCGLHFTIL